MLEQLKKYWAKVSEHPFLKHLFIIVCVLLVLGIVLVKPIRHLVSNSKED